MSTKAYAAQSAASPLAPFLIGRRAPGVGAPPDPHPSPSVGSLIFGRRSIAGSLIGGIAETQEMLDFCAEKGITSEIEMIPIQDIEKAYARMLKSDVKYRFVIDMQSLKDAA